MSAFDAIVVGAGPAGAVTARELARRGWRVLLLDRHAFPRAKPCGDCLSPEAARVLDRLGLLESVEALAPAHLHGWRIRAHDGSGFVGTFERAANGDARVRSAIAIARDRLDDALLRAALDAGVELRAPVRVEDLAWSAGRVAGIVVRDRGAREMLNARLVIGADGLRSVVARRAGATAHGPLRKHSLTVHARLPREFTGGAGEMHVVPSGCIGIAPVEAGGTPLHNVTFVTLSDARRGMRPAALMRAMLDAAPALADRRAALLDAIAAADAPLASGPFDRPSRFVVADGLALVGDAAGYYDPFTGQGVYQALSGGERLAAVAHDALSRASTVRAKALRPYARWLASSRRPARGVQRAIEYVAARPALMSRFTRAIERAPAFGDALVAVTGDMAPVGTLAGRPLASLGGGLVRTLTRSRT